MTKLDTDLTSSWKNYDKINSKYEKRLTLEYKMVFDALQKEVVSNLGSEVKSELFSLSYYLNYVFNITKKTKTNLINETLSLFFKDVDINYNSSSFNEELNKVLKDSLKLDEKSLKTIRDELKAQVRSIKDLNPDLNKKELLNKLVSEINMKFDLNYKSSRIKMITQTVATYTSEDSKKKAGKKIGIGRQWISQRDSKVRPNHRKLDGVKEDKDGKFNLGGRLTSQPAGENLPARELVNCRCFTRGFKI